jgi:hypothetical protein
MYGLKCLLFGLLCIITPLQLGAAGHFCWNLIGCLELMLLIEGNEYSCSFYIGLVAHW